MVNQVTNDPENSEEKENILKRFWDFIKVEIVQDFKRSNILGVPFFITRGIEINYFFIVPAVSTLAILMLIFVPLHRYPTDFVFQISCILIFLANIASLFAVALWRWLVERHYKEHIEKRRQIRDTSIFKSAARFASPFLTPDDAHPVRRLLGLWVKDNLLYILPAVILVALFPSDILMLDPVMEGGISSIFTYIILFLVMANLLTLCAFTLFFAVRWVFVFIGKITGTLSGASYLDRR